MCGCLDVWQYGCVDVYVHMCVCKYVYKYVHIHADRQIARQTCRKDKSSEVKIKSDIYTWTLQGALHDVSKSPRAA